MKKDIILATFEKMLRDHDWYYEYEDSFDSGAYLRGKEQRRKIEDYVERHSLLSEELKLLLKREDSKHYPFTPGDRSGDTLVTTVEDSVEKILKERASTHGDSRKNFKRVSETWSAYLEKEVTALDVALMMVEFKIARIKNNNGYHEDNYLDAIGYLKLAKQLAEESDDR